MKPDGTPQRAHDARTKAPRLIIARMIGMLEGAVALVTGVGQPDGIGFATARILGREGARLAITATGDHVFARAAELNEMGFEAFGLVADLTVNEEAREMVAGVVARYARIDALVNNAGAAVGGPFVDLDEASWDRDISLSLKTVYNVTRPVLPLMFAQRGGRIVMVASTSGATIGSPNWSAYSAAKAGIVGLVRTLAVEVGRHGVTVNAVNPGWINTREVDISARPDYGNTPVGRVGEPEEIGEVVAFLASERARFITGQEIIVDGGAAVQDSDAEEWYRTDPTREP